ncbi:hypothetical protein BCV70DRAFT_163734 [Testicularia cyperi]|uniref:F-box protein Hrt3/FBXO9 C-terminal domain-containing protein n=1 Tax=Testicularia cyperi TaxID=1882483 RepID=A0A317XLD2_9BASI|nr:hypothetical protein BCV70DRAFT_163734 [Testicularia cyperi]
MAVNHGDLPRHLSRSNILPSDSRHPPSTNLHGQVTHVEAAAHLPEPDTIADVDLDDDIDLLGTPQNADSSGVQTPAERITATSTPAPPDSGLASHPPAANDELERFRQEWKQEVSSRGDRKALTPSSAPTTGYTPKSTSGKAAHASSSSHPVPPSSTENSVEIDKQHEPDTHLPFPEAEIFGPAALKYSKGAHKLPPSASNASHEATSTTDLPQPAVRSEYKSPDSQPSADVPADRTAASRVRDRVRSSAIPFSSSTGAGRPLAPKMSVVADSISAAPAESFTQQRRVMVSSDAPTNASQGTQAGIKSAVEAYAHAVELERSGQLDEALTSYRRAFKLNSNADRLYHRAHLLLTDPSLAKASSQQSDALLSSPAVAEKVRKALDFDDHRYVAIKERQAREAQARDRGEPTEVFDATSQPTAEAPLLTTSTGALVLETRQDQLTMLMDKLSVDQGGERDFSTVAFVPEDEEQDMPLARLPDELLLHILRMLILPRGKRGAKIVKPKPTPEEQAAIDQANGLQRRGGNHKTRPPPDANTKEAAVANGHASKPVSKQQLLHARTPSTSAPTSAGPTIDPVKAQEPADQHKGATNGTGEAEATVGPGTVSTRRKNVGIGVVLGGCDWQTLEILGRTCWKWRLLTKSPGLWKQIVHETYYPPILDPAVSCQMLYERHHSDWRTVFVNQPRVRLNGCYIAACHYARRGMSEESAWINVIHVVEFYRSVRFLPDGTALSLLTTESPSETVRKLEPGLKQKGFSTGTWDLFEHGLEDDEVEGRPPGPKVVVENLRDKSMHKYAFRMVFSLKSTSPGKWNKLVLLDYFSINLTNGECLPLPQKHSRPFHFSRVIPYGI